MLRQQALDLELVRDLPADALALPEAGLVHRQVGQDPADRPTHRVLRRERGGQALLDVGRGLGDAVVPAVDPGVDRRDDTPSGAKRDRRVRGRPRGRDQMAGGPRSRHEGDGCDSRPRPRAGSSAAGLGDVPAQARVHDGRDGLQGPQVAHLFHWLGRRQRVLLDRPVAVQVVVQGVLPTALVVAPGDLRPDDCGAVRVPAVDPCEAVHEHLPARRDQAARDHQQRHVVARRGRLALVELDSGRASRDQDQLVRLCHLYS